jgi:hypothetical protein
MAALAASEPPTITPQVLEERLTFLMQQPRDDKFIRALGDIKEKLLKIIRTNTDIKILTHAKRLLDEITDTEQASDDYLFGKPTESSMTTLDRGGVLTGEAKTNINKSIGVKEQPQPISNIIMAKRMNLVEQLRQMGFTQPEHVLLNLLKTHNDDVNAVSNELLGLSGGKRKRKTKKRRMTRRRKHKKSKTRKSI